eukprot:95605-Hanusia_phi.AAC.3
MSAHHVSQSRLSGLASSSSPMLLSCLSLPALHLRSFLKPLRGPLIPTQHLINSARNFRRNVTVRSVSLSQCVTVAASPRLGRHSRALAWVTRRRRDRPSPCQSTSARIPRLSGPARSPGRCPCDSG